MQNGSPAHAGIDPLFARVRWSALRFPRPRGDRPFSNTVDVGGDTVPPPTRG